MATKAASAMPPRRAIVAEPAGPKASIDVNAPAMTARIP